MRIVPRCSQAIGNTFRVGHDMCAHDDLSGFATPVSDDLKNAFMLMPTDFRLGVSSQVKPQIGTDSETKPRDLGTEPSTAAQLADQIVEFVMPFHPGKMIVPHAAQAGKKRFEIVHHIADARLGCDPSSKSLKHGAHLEQLKDFLRRSAGDDRAAVRADRNVAFGIELPDRLAHGHAADAKSLGQRLRLQAAATRKGTGDNLVLKMDVR